MLAFLLGTSALAGPGGELNPERVSGAFHVPEQPFRRVEVSNSASCWVYKVVDDKGQPVVLPKVFADALDCPSVISVRGNVLTINVGLTIRQVDLRSKQERTLFSVYEDNEGISGPIFSPDGRRMAFVVIDQLKNQITCSFVCDNSIIASFND